MATKLTPVRHATLPDHHRVPVMKVDGRYEIYVEENYVRIYDDNDLPDLIKSRMAMAKAGTRSPVADEMLYNAQIYECGSDNKHLADIGWVVDPNLCVLVLPTKYLTYLASQEYPETYRQIEGFGFLSSKSPTFVTYEGYIEWQHLKSRSKTKLNQF